MSEGQETQATEGGAPAPETQARELGWEPKESFKGDPKNWVPAEEYLKRGENILPYLQADRKRLFRKVDAQGAEIQRLSGALAESTEAINTLKQFTASDALKKKDQEIAGLRRQLAEARRGGDVNVEVELETQLETAKEERGELATQIRAKPNGEGVKSDEVTDPIRSRIQGLTQTPEWQGFIRDNPWYEQDSVARAVATAISGEIMQDPANRELSFGDKLSLVAEQTKARLGMGQQTRTRTKVEGSRGGSTSGPRSSSSPSYESLSPEAQAACDRQAKTVVGPNRAFKTEAEWRSHYAKMVS